MAFDPMSDFSNLLETIKKERKLNHDVNKVQTSTSGSEIRAFNVISAQGLKGSQHSTVFCPVPHRVVGKKETNAQSIKDHVYNKNKNNLYYKNNINHYYQNVNNVQEITLRFQNQNNVNYSRNSCYPIQKKTNNQENFLQYDQDSNVYNQVQSVNHTHALNDLSIFLNQNQNNNQSTAKNPDHQPVSQIYQYQNTFHNGRNSSGQSSQNLSNSFEDLSSSSAQSPVAELQPKGRKRVLEIDEDEIGKLSLKKFKKLVNMAPEEQVPVLKKMRRKVKNKYAVRSLRTKMDNQLSSLSNQWESQSSLASNISRAQEILEHSWDQGKSLTQLLVADMQPFLKDDPAYKEILLKLT